MFEKKQQRRKQRQQLRDHLQGLKDALVRGEKRVVFEGKSVEYRTPEELKLAITLLERDIRRDRIARGKQERPPRQIRVTTKKGF
jgi:hypothetical protein